MLHYGICCGSAGIRRGGVAVKLGRMNSGGGGDGACQSLLTL